MLIFSCHISKVEPQFVRERDSEKPPSLGNARVLFWYGTCVWKSAKNKSFKDEDLNTTSFFRWKRISTYKPTFTHFYSIFSSIENDLNVKFDLIFFLKKSYFAILRNKLQEKYSPISAEVYFFLHLTTETRRAFSRRRQALLWRTLGIWKDWDGDTSGVRA